LARKLFSANPARIGRFDCAPVTGPSATGDIEGVLIHAAQGVRTLNITLIPRSRPGHLAIGSPVTTQS
jgi:hypothetical protein